MLIGFLIACLPTSGSDVIQETKKTEKSEKRGLKRMRGDNPARKPEVDDNQLIRSEEHRKKDIEIREHTTARNKKVKRFAADENLSGIIHNRNIP